MLPIYMRGNKKQRIIRILLNRKSLTKYRLAKLAETSFPWTHEFLKQLENKKLIKGTEVIKPKELLYLWSKLRKKPIYREYMIREPLELLKITQLKFALTTYLGENLTQSHLFPLRIDIYIQKQDLKKWHKMLSGKGFYGKGNFRILIDEDEHVFDFTKKTGIGLSVVSMPQLIVDLIQEGGPCEEAAELLIKRYFENVQKL